MVKRIKKREGSFLLVAILSFFVVIWKYYPLYELTRDLTLEYRALIYKIELGNIPAHPISTGFASTIPVLTYHGIVEEPDGVNVTLSNFKNQMFTLKKEGWQTISFVDFFAFMQGEKQLPERSFLLTFDDGQKLSYYPVDPVLNALNFRAVTFVITKQSLGEGSSYYLSKEELERMLSNGRWEVQVHAKDAHETIQVDKWGNRGHFLSNKMWLEKVGRLESDQEYESRILSEFKLAKLELEQSLGVKVIGYAYPFGDFGQGTVNYPEAKETIVKSTQEIFPLYQAYQVWEGGGYTYNYPDVSKDNFLIKRVSVSPKWLAGDLVGVLEMGKDKFLPYSDYFVSNGGWKGVSAEITVADGKFAMIPELGSTSALTFLDGSALWKDYVYRFYVENFRGNTLSLVARYRDNDNFVQCDFKPDSVRIKMRYDGQERVISEKRIKTIQLSGRVLGISVKGTGASCIVENDVVALGNLPEGRLSTGGVGLKIWDSAPSSASLVAKNLIVE